MNPTTRSALLFDHHHGENQHNNIAINRCGPASAALQKIQQRSELSMKRQRSIDNGIWNLEPDESTTLPTFEFSKMMIGTTTTTTTHDDKIQSHSRCRSASPERKRLRTGLKRTAKFLNLSAPALLLSDNEPLDGAENAIWHDLNDDDRKGGCGLKKVKKIWVLL